MITENRRNSAGSNSASSGVLRNEKFAIFMCNFFLSVSFQLDAVLI